MEFNNIRRLSNEFIPHIGNDSAFNFEEENIQTSPRKFLPNPSQPSPDVVVSSMRYRNNDNMGVGGDSALHLALEALTISDSSSSSSSKSSVKLEQQTVTVDYVSTNVLFDLKGHKRGIWRLASSTPERVISASYDHNSFVWNWTQKQLLGRFAHDSEVLSLAIADGKIFTGSSDGCLKIWNAEDLTAIGSFSEPERYRTGFYSIAPIGKGLIATGACQQPRNAQYHWAHNVKIWNAENGKFLYNLKGHKGGIPKIIKIQDANLVTCSSDKTIKIWNTVNKTCQATLEGHTDYIYSMCQNQHNQIVSCSRDGLLICWDLDTGVQLGYISDPSLDRSHQQQKAIAHTSTIYDVCQVQLNVIASASRDGGVKVWDLRSREVVSILKPNDGFIYSVCALGNRALAAGTQGGGKQGLEMGKIHIWEFNQS